MTGSNTKPEMTWTRALLQAVSLLVSLVILVTIAVFAYNRTGDYDPPLPSGSHETAAP